MTTRLSYHELAGGGPVQPGEAYRWNLPVLTYGFDPDFVASPANTVQTLSTVIPPQGLQWHDLPRLGIFDGGPNPPAPLPAPAPAPECLIVLSAYGGGKLRAGRDLDRRGSPQ